MKKNLISHVSAVVLALGCQTQSHVLEAEMWEEESLPVVLTPVRLKQNRSDVPASVSVIDRRMIEVSGIRRIPELFRLIPGTVVAAKDGWNHVVSYHGTNHRQARRMQVLIDGRSVYQPGLATVDWNDLPITIEDIERIEIVRGPSSASYGANAFLGVINIITRHPADTASLHLLSKRGDGKIEDYRLAHAGKIDSSAYRITLASRRDDGFDSKANGDDRRDSDNSDLFNIRVNTELNASELQLGMGYKQGWITDDINYDPWVTPQDTYTKDYFLSAKLSWQLNEDHQQYIRLDHAGQKQQRELTAIIPDQFIGLDLDSDPNNFTLVYADTDENQHVKRYDLEFQDTVIWNERLKSVAGVHYQIDQAASETFYNGKVDNNSLQIFGNIEIGLTDKLAGNIAVLWEDQDTTGSSLSPRLALNYHLAKNHSLRAVYSGAVRTPDLLETSADWNYYARNVRELDGSTHAGMTTGVYQCGIQPSPDLKSEKIYSQELGYYGNFQQLGLQVDLKLYRERLRDLVSSIIKCDVEPPNNSRYLDLRGAELEIDYRPNPAILLRGNLAYIDGKSHHIYSNELSLTPKTIASLLFDYSLNGSTHFSYARYYTEKIPHWQGRNTTFSRSDFRLSHRLIFEYQQLEFAYVIRIQHDENSELLADNIHDDRSRQLFTLSYQF